MAVATYVGSFAKATGTGNQDVTIPVDMTAASDGTWAIMFWTTDYAGNPNSWYTSVGAFTSVGFVTRNAATVNQYSASSSSATGVGTSQASRRMAAAAITITNLAGSLQDEATFTSFPSSTTMRLNWVTQGLGGVTQQIHYMLITGLTGAKVVDWQMPTTAIAKSVTGVGFIPDLVMNISNQAATGGTLPVSTTFGVGGIGVMNKHGQQWANAFASRNAVAPSKTARGQQTDACLLGVDVTVNAVYWEAAFKSMDADGFSVNFSTVTTAATDVFSLCLKGVSSKIGAFLQTVAAAPNTQEVITRHNFTPRGIIMSGWSDVALAAPTSQIYWTLGASDGTNSRVAAMHDLNNAGTGGSPTSTSAIATWRNESIYVESSGSATGVDWNRANLSGLGNQSFTLNWTVSANYPSERLYILLGDASTNTFPTRVYQNDTRSDPTAFSNQRKLIALSTGRKVALFNTGTSTAQVLWSDDGVTWTDYGGGANIAGFLNGSIAAYVDSGGVERLVTVWKQNGTGGSRTDLNLYVLVGTFNAGRTTLTWGTATTVSGSTETQYNYPDLVVHAEGTGGKAHLIYSYAHNSTANNGVYYSRYTINSSGVISAADVSETGIPAAPGYGLNTHTWPSIDINPTTKDLYAAWSAGTTGAGKGLRFKKATWSAGPAWSWGTEREIDNAIYAPNDSIGVVCRFDGTAVIIAGVLQTTVPIRFIYERDAADTTTFQRQRSDYSYSVDTSVVSYPTVAIDPGSRDVYFVGGNYGLWLTKWTRSTGVETQTKVDHLVTNGAGPRAIANATSSRIEWLYAVGNNTPYSVKYDYIPLYNPQVGLTTPTNNTSANLNAGYTFNWSYYAPDAATQTGWAFRRIRSSDSTIEYWNNGTTSWQAMEIYNTGTATGVTFGSGKWPVGQAYTWTVSVQNATGVSGYAPAFTVTDSGAATGVDVKVGSFTKQTSTGFQTISSTGVDLSTAPQGTWTIMFWTAGSGAASGTWAANALSTLGFTTGPANSFAIATASYDALATADTGGRMAAKAITLMNPNPTGLVAEADFVSGGNGQFVVNWTRNETGGGFDSSVINYMIISGLTNAKVVQWASPGSGTTQSVTGVGFQPDLVMHAGWGGTGAVGTSSTYAYSQFGLMNKHGQQWSNSWVSADGVTANTSRWQQTDSCLIFVNNTDAIYADAKFKSMDADGFSLDWAVMGSTQKYFSLCLKGVSSKIGAFIKPVTTTGNQAVTARHGFTLKGALFSNIGSDPNSSISRAGWALGAADTTNVRSAALFDMDNVNPTRARAVWRSDKVIDVPDDLSTSRAVAGWTSATTTDFTVNWTTNDSLTAEILYLLLGNAATNTSPDLVGTSTNVAATAYGNQKKLIALSTGRKVAVYGDTTTNAKFKWSDDGLTWTDYSADIPGWSNGSIASYVDYGGTERIVAAWTQTGTGGGRTDTYSYAMVGTFNTARTTLTWDTSAANGSGTNGRYDSANGVTYSDLVVVAEGSGGYVHILSSYVNSGSFVRENHASIDSSGVLGNMANNHANLSTYASSTNHTFPSLTFNPVTKDLYGSWSAGATGAGKGIRFRKATYSAGAWTWGTEVEADNTVYSVNQQYFANCRWDGTAVVIGGNLYDGTNYRMRIWESTNFTSFSSLVNVSNAGLTPYLYNSSMAIDAVTRNVYLFGTTTLDAVNYYEVGYRRYNRSSVTFESLVITDVQLMGLQHHVSTLYNPSADRMEWIYTSGNNSPYAIKYDYLQLNKTPVVTLTAPADNFSVNLNTTSQNFAWTVSDTDSDTQAKYVFRRRKPGATTATYEYWTGSAWTATLTEVVSTTNNVTITSNTWGGSQSWLWSVGVRDTSAASPIGYSSERTITNSGYTPSVGTYVGSFTKATGTGNQDITIAPDLTAAAAGTWAIIFWTTASDAATGTWSSLGWGAYPSIGFVANGGGTITEYSLATATKDNSAAADTGRRMATKAITLINVDVTTWAEANFVSFPTSTTMRLNWSSNASNSPQINYMIITGLTGAKAITWNEPASGSDKSVTGVGFKPDLVFSASDEGSINSSSVHAIFGFGVFNKHGQQWANGFQSDDGATPSNTERAQQTDAGFVTPNGTVANYYGQAHFKSMDADGFTFTFSSGNSGDAVISLCLQGVSSKLGVFTKTNAAAPASQQITRLGFTPKALLMSTQGNTPQAAPTQNATWGLGASDGTNDRVAYFTDQDGAGTGGSPTTTQAKSLWVSGKSIATHSAIGVTGAVANVSAFASGSFTLNWTTNDSVQGEISYLALGDPATNTTPQTFTTSTLTTGRHYSHQRRLARLSTGRIVVVNADSAGTASFRYSDDGVAWADYLADIVGWSNGSIHSYVDAGGVERLCAVWLQTGTGGGRTSGDVYFAVGTLNAARTTITWGTAATTGFTGQPFFWPDLVTHPEANGGRAHVVFSQTGGTTNRTWYGRYAIDGLGTVTIDYAFAFGLADSYTVAKDTFPSIDYNPVTKDLYFAWSAGTTGSGKGIRFKKSTYYNGAWTWGSEIDVSTAHYDSHYAEMSTICRWDGTRVIIGGNQFNGTTYGIGFWQSSNFTSFTNKTAVTGITAGTSETNGAWSPGLAVDAATGDVLIIGYRIGLPVGLGYYKYTRGSDTWGSRVETEEFQPTVADYPNVSANAYNGKLEWAYMATGNNSPYAVKYDYLAVNAAPLVTLVLPEAGARVDLLNNSQNFSWTFTDADSNTQSAYIFRRRRDGYSAPNYDYWTGSAWTTTYTEVTSSTANVTIGAGNFKEGKIYYWSVGVKDSAGSIGYSAERKLTNTAAAVNTYVGSFTKSSSTGNQDITITPDLTAAAAGSWAIMFWTAGSTGASGTWTSQAEAMIGYVANGGGTISQYSVANFSEDNQATSNSSRRMAAAAITQPTANGADYRSEATFVSFPSSTTMRINWSRNDVGNYFTINYMIITGLGGAKAIPWATNTSIGDKSFTGVGFQPDLVLHASSYTTGTLPQNSTDAPLGFGAMNKHGQQWSNSARSNDGIAGATANRTGRGQQTDAAVLQVSATVTYIQGHYKSMDADGFTMNISSTDGSVPINFISLAMKGLSSKIGPFVGGTSGSQVTTTAHNFTARGLLLSGISDPPAGTTLTQALWTMGAYDGTNVRAASLSDQDAVNPTRAYSIWSNTAIPFMNSLGTPPTAFTYTPTALGTTSITGTWSITSTAEFLYLLVGDADNDTVPAQVGTSTSSAPTAYPNQKKLIRLSTGRLVEAYGDSGTNAKFKYSDDGITWTDMGADIAGWSNGSIYAFTLGGNDFIAATWEQSGTAGGRLDLSTYLMIGALNSSRTAITWGTASANGIGDSRFNYPDLVVTPEGTGAKVHVVVSFVIVSGGTNNEVDYYRYSVDSNGVLLNSGNYDVATTIGAPYGVTVHTWPSIDWNPTTKDLYAAWSAGTTGAGKGIRFKKATYSAGTWTWGAEREIDSTHYNDGVGNWLNCMFDGTRVIIGGEVYTGSVLDLMLYERDVADTTTTTRNLAAGITGATRAAQGSMSYDQLGNVIMIATQGGTGSSPYYRVWTRATNTLGAQVVFDGAFGGGWISTKRGYSSNRIEWVYTYGNNAPYAVKYSYLQASDASNDNKFERWGIIPI